MATGLHNRHLAKYSSTLSRPFSRFATVRRPSQQDGIDSASRWIPVAIVAKGRGRRSLGFRCGDLRITHPFFRYLMLFIAFSLQVQQFRCVGTLLDECAYANDQAFDRITHPWTTRVRINFESIRTPSSSPRLSMVELTAVFLSTTIQVRGRGWRCHRLRRPARWQRARLLAGTVKMELSLWVRTLA